MKRIIGTALMAMWLTLPAEAQDFGYPREKAQYKAHWQEIVKDLGRDKWLGDAEYVLYDFNHDGQAELFLHLQDNDEYVYALKNNRAVRVSETNRKTKDAFWLGQFFPFFTAPYEMLVDKTFDRRMATEQQIYDMEDMPRLWFKLRPQVTGSFNLKQAIKALNSFDCRFLSDAMYALHTGQYDRREVSEYVMDTANGYARITYRNETQDELEFAVWNTTDGRKLMAMHYQVAQVMPDGRKDVTERIMFMRYDPKTRVMTPIVAPIKGYDFTADVNLQLPRKGKNILMTGAGNHELKWTGTGFKF